MNGCTPTHKDTHTHIHTHKHTHTETHTHTHTHTQTHKHTNTQTHTHTHTHTDTHTRTTPQSKRGINQSKRNINPIIGELGVCFCFGGVHEPSGIGANFSAFSCAAAAILRHSKCAAAASRHMPLGHCGPWHGPKPLTSSGQTSAGGPTPGPKKWRP